MSDAGNRTVNVTDLFPGDIISYGALPGHAIVIATYSDRERELTFIQLNVLWVRIDGSVIFHYGTYGVGTDVLLITPYHCKDHSATNAV